MPNVLVFHHFIPFYLFAQKAVCKSSEQFNNTMSKTYQAHKISAYGSLIVVGLETSKYSA